MEPNHKHTAPCASAKRIDELERALRASQATVGELAMEVGQLRATANNTTASIDKLPGFRERVARMRNMSTERGKDDYKALVAEIHAWHTGQSASVEAKELADLHTAVRTFLNAECRSDGKRYSQIIAPLISAFNNVGQAKAAAKPAPTDERIKCLLCEATTNADNPEETCPGCKDISAGEAAGEWAEAQRVSDLPLVDEAIRGLLEDPTGDNATCLIREVLRAAPAATKAAPGNAEGRKPKGCRDTFNLMFNARRIASTEMNRSENWVLARDLFAVGSTTAHAICHEAGIDPRSRKVEPARSTGQQGTGKPVAP
ncbi:MAG: hypothetical protein WA191_05235 [Telluria sp.]